MIKKSRIIVLLLICAMLSPACVFMPKKVESEFYEDESCELATKKLTLDVHVSEGGSDLMGSMIHACDGSNEPECALIVLVPVAVVSAGSMIVSGSIVVVGNTVHWIEKQGRCDDSMTRKAVKGLVNSTKKAGGWVVKSGKELINWIKGGAAMFRSEPEEE